MMLFFFFYLLGLLYGACSYEVCLFEAHIECPFSSLIPSQLPGTEEELRNACSNLNNIKQCLSDYEKNCSSVYAEASEDPEEYNINAYYRRYLKSWQRLIDVTTEICKEDSQLHSNFVPHMACYQEIYDAKDSQQLCKDYSNNTMKYIESRLTAKLLQIGEQTLQYYECLQVLFEMNCYLEQFIQKCSTRAKDTVIEMIEIGGTLDDQCPLPIRIDILELIDATKLLTRKEMPVRKLLEIDSFF